MHVFDRVLIANRGEIAVRIIRTLRHMGISPIAIYSDADRNAPHVRLADEAYCIGAAPARESYLCPGALLRVAREAQADAIHPGYGFLSENAEFAASCAAEGLVFIGPSAESIRLMGSKIGARALMASHGVPVVPGYNGEAQDLDTLVQKASEIGFPILVKASAGGGGKGMRIVRSPSEVESAIASAQREAISAFGDGTVLLERYIDSPRHIEFQIFGDQQGNLIHLFERECSIQRRYQKIIEESPSSLFERIADGNRLRFQMAQAAITAGRAIGYFNAGTVEFIVSPGGEYFFLEVNTRLQVEHPVTEGTTGLDLVRMQIEVAQGLPLSVSQEEVLQTGHTVEVRIYAEDTTRGFLPSTGTLTDWYLPEMPGVRLDSGVERGTEVGIHYDPMLAKLIASGRDRRDSHRRLAGALERLSVAGVSTNRDLLLRLVRHPVYVAGDIHTHFIEEHLTHGLQQEAPALETILEAIAVATVFRAASFRDPPGAPSGIPFGYRNNRFRDQEVSYRCDTTRHECSYRALDANRYRAVVSMALLEILVLTQTEDSLRAEINGVQRTYRVLCTESHIHVQWPRGHCELVLEPRFPSPEGARDTGETVAPMPGKVTQVLVQPGDRVLVGQPLMTLEAMKMEHTIQSPVKGLVDRVTVGVGALVPAGAVLVHLTAEEAGTESDNSP